VIFIEILEHLPLFAHPVVVQCFIVLSYPANSYS